MSEFIDNIRLSKKTTVIRNNSIELHTGHEVFKLLSEEGFLQGWDALYQVCPWATAFQSRSFVATWYQVYQNKYLPIVVKRVENGQLTGLLTMAKDDNGVIIGAGGNLAEYQVWLAADASGEAFITSALTKIRNHFKGAKVRFTYIPGNTPLRWATHNAGWSKYCVVRICRQAIMKIDEAKISTELKKKNRREKVNRLKRLGELTFERITDNDLFSAIFNELTIQYDFRQGAKFNKNFFQADPLRGQFLLLLFEQKLLHVTLLKLNDAVIASNVGITGKNWVHLQGVNTHDPQYARYSPGILHFLMLGKQLAEEGIEVFDLTPGGNLYKEDLANDFTHAYELCVGSVPFRITSGLKFFLTDFFKKAIVKIGIQPKTFQNIKKSASQIKEKAIKIKEEGFFATIKNIRYQVGVLKEIQIYATTLNTTINSGAASIEVKRDSLADLLEFEAKGTWMTRWEFLENAMRRFEAGEHCYSWCAEDRLLGCVWLDKPKTFLSDEKSNSITENAALLKEFYCHPAGREQLLPFLSNVTIMAAMDQKQCRVYALINAKDTHICQSLKKIGFEGVDEKAKN